MKSPKTPSPKQNKVFEQAFALHRSGKLAEASILYKRLLRSSPKNTLLLTNLGTITVLQGHLEEGAMLIERSLRIDPNQAHAHTNLGNALQALRKLDKALLSHDRAIAINPNLATAYANRANVMQALKQLDDAMKNYDRALAIDPNHVEANWNKALLTLLLGNFEEGWRRYEWRWQNGMIADTPRNYRQPLWIGEPPLVGKTLLVYPEQGLGDFIQFCRYVPLLEQLGTQIVLEVRPPLLAIMATLAGNFTRVETGKPLPNFDYYCPLMSLPLAFKTTMDTIPAQIPYLYTDPDKQLAWRERLGEKTKPRIGLVWSGSTSHIKDPIRSIPLKLFEPLFKLPFEFHSLQKEIRREDTAFIARSGAIITNHHLLADFSDTGALIDAMDLVISVDTSVAHLAGALGKKLWLLLPFMPDFRWLLDRKDSPWYPTATLFRQPTIDDWQSVIDELDNKLSETI